jgi:hypothetical protein
MKTIVTILSDCILKVGCTRIMLHSFFRSDAYSNKRVMKIIISILLMLLAGPVTAQHDSSGVYMSAQDYINANLKYAINCKTQRHKINQYALLGKGYIKVTHEGVKYKFNKNEVFGYRDCNNSVYRFVENEHYEILNPGESILLYKHSYMAGKNTTVTENYFSVGTGPIMVLSLTNLKKAFPDNHKFHDMLDTEFSSGAVGLTSYDSYHKIYKVNRLYLNSLSD